MNRSLCMLRIMHGEGDNAAGVGDNCDTGYRTLVRERRRRQQSECHRWMGSGCSEGLTNPCPSTLQVTRGEVGDAEEVVVEWDTSGVLRSEDGRDGGHTRVRERRRRKHREHHRWMGTGAAKT
jgi:hypothetical protein